MLLKATNTIGVSTRPVDRRGEIWDKLSRAPLRLGAAVAQKYKVHQNAPYWKAKFKTFSPRRALQECCPRAPRWLSTSLVNTTITQWVPIINNTMFPAATAAPFARNVARRGILVISPFIFKFCYVLFSFLTVHHGIRDGPLRKRGADSRRLKAHYGSAPFGPRSTTDASTLRPGPKKADEKAKMAKSIWVREWLSEDRRQQLGHSTFLTREFRTKDVNAFQNYRRMSPKLFDEILERITLHIERQDTKLRSVLPRRLKLSLTLRHLASRDNYSSLLDAFRCSKTVICHMLPEVCKAIVEAYKD